MSRGLYSCALVAFKREYEGGYPVRLITSLRTMAASALSEEGAKSTALEYAQQVYPCEDGWFDHLVDVMLLDNAVLVDHINTPEQ